MLTQEKYQFFELQLEWCLPKPGNSGIIFQARYEVQVLNSYQNKTYPDGQAGSIYKQHIPLVNAMRPTGEW